VSTTPPDYKDTVNLPVTEFPMRGNLAQTEPNLIARWKQKDIYNKVIAKNKAGGKNFTMPDGPPYANGNIHIGHALNKILKDIVLKYKNMQGYQAEFIPGWDCHGLPIELKVTAALGSKKNDLSKKQIRELCRKEAEKWIGIQQEQFIRLGLLADWENPYYTMQPAYEAEEIRVIAEIQKNGVLYRGEKPVYWCPALQTALAAAEVEYHDHKSPSIYVKFNIEKLKGPLKDLKKKVSVVIWTTTPWTLPANYGIALNKNFEYGVYDLTSSANEQVIIATELKEAFEKDAGVTLSGPVKIFKGAELENTNARHPFMNRDSLIILGDHVSLEAGTGAVHTAPGHGLDDYQVGLKYKLPVHSPVDAAGKYTSDVPQYVGMKIWDANKKIVEDLTSSGHLIAVKEITHSYPHNPRSKTPLIFRATPQWFIRMDDNSFGLRKKALDMVEKQIKFVPDWGRPRLTAMVSNTPDWCLSRQRIWGVPIPVFFCKACGEALAEPAVMHRVADKMESSGLGIEAYFDTPVEEFVGNEKCKKCGAKEFTKSDDILDVWFDSGICHTAVQKKRPGLKFPADIYLEGSDQHRGWFQTSLMSSVAAYEKPPFDALITHGFVNDAQGHKMSKSKGNVIDPHEVIKKYGAEILRLWVTYEDYGQDVSVSDEMFQRVSETYRRIRNTMRYLLGNLPDFNPKTDAVEFAKMPEMDRWMMLRLDQLIRECTAAYDGYNFFKVYHALNVFFTVDVSATYMDMLKDRMYTGKKSGHARRSSQTVFYNLLMNLTGLMAPILTFLAEEVNDYLPGDKSESVFLRPFPKPLFTDAEVAAQKPLQEQLAELFKVREEVGKQLESIRREKVIGSGLDAQLQITAKGAALKALQGYKDLREFFIVSKATVVDGSATLKGEFEAKVSKADGEKCTRCWHYSTEIGKDSKYPGICPKCVEALS
jgi:isoleucyl-tRNA synthetase